MRPERTRLSQLEDLNDYYEMLEGEDNSPSPFEEQKLPAQAPDANIFNISR